LIEKIQNQGPTCKKRETSGFEIVEISGQIEKNKSLMVN
jgi:hypothetical protein